MSPIHVQTSLTSLGVATHDAQPRAPRLGGFTGVDSCLRPTWTSPAKVVKCEQPDSGCTVGGRDAAARSEVLPTQDADENGDLDQ